MEQGYLTLGDMLTFVGLIIAALQFLKPRYLLIWRLSNNFIKFLAITLLIVGYFLPLASILMPHSNKVVWNNMTLDQLLQIAGFVAITLGLSIVVYIYTRFNRSHLVITIPKFKFASSKFPKKDWRSIHAQVDRKKIITMRSADKFYDITSKFLVRGNIEEVVEIIHHNLPALVRSALLYVPERFRIDPKPDPNKKPTKQDGSNYAFEILYQLLTDEAVMKHICTNNYPFLHDLVLLENKFNPYGRSELAEVLYENLMEHLILNQGSLLYTQKDANKGTARFVNVYKLLTNTKITEQHRIIPSMLTYHVDKTDIPLDKYVDVLLRLLERMVKSYKKKPGSEQLLDNIRQVLDQLIGDSGVTRRLAYDKEERQNYSKDIVKSTAYKVLSQIERAITSDLMFSDKDPDIFKNNDAELKGVTTRGAYDQKTLTGLFAHKVYELIEDMTILHYDAEDPDGNLFRETHSYISIYSDTATANRYKELLWEKLFDKAVDGKIEQYSTNIAGYYPNVFRFIVQYLVPFSEYQIKQNPQAVSRLKSIMANELKDALLSGKKMANDKPMKDVLLPPKVQPVINKTKKTVKYYHINSKGKKKIIDLG